MIKISWSWKIVYPNFHSNITGVYDLDIPDTAENWQAGETGSTTEWFGDVPTVATFPQDDLHWITSTLGKSEHHCAAATPVKY